MINAVLAKNKKGQGFKYDNCNTGMVHLTMVQSTSAIVGTEAINTRFFMVTVKSSGQYTSIGKNTFVKTSGLDLLAIREEKPQWLITNPAGESGLPGAIGDRLILSFNVLSLK